jgi:hypothetical protein
VLHRTSRIDGRSAVQSLDERLLTLRLIDIYRSILPASKSDEAEVGADLQIA